jgi:hypothetical protein
MKKFFGFVVVNIIILFFLGNTSFAQSSQQFILSTGRLKSYVSYFNSIDTEAVKNYVPNKDAFSWLAKNIPLFDCPDTTLEKIYYYRWWSFRKHLEKTPDGYVFTEFITPMKHAGKYNTISSALGHHIYEGRWLHDPEYINDYINFWLHVDKKTPSPHLHNFSSWLQNAVYNRYLVTPDKSFIRNNLPALDSDYHRWEKERQLPDGKFWQYDVKDAMEESISGGRHVKNVRPTINSYMYGNAVAMVDMAKLFGNTSLEKKYNEKAASLKSIVQNYLWNDSASFFEVRLQNGKFSDAREEIGFIPWYFNLPDNKPKYAKAWNQLIDTTGFCAPWGITTAERRNPGFRTHGSGHGCEWDGAVWPFATTQTLKGLANLLTNYKNKGTMNKEVFYKELNKYASSQQKRGRPYIGEYQDEKTGEWLKEDNPRSEFYNHSGFADLIINDLIGLKPRLDDVVEIFPLIPAGQWDWFCLDQVLYHGKMLTILWDKNGKKYGKGTGFIIYANGKEIYKGKELKHVMAKM